MVYVCMCNSLSHCTTSVALVSELTTIIEVVSDNEPLPLFTRDMSASPLCFRHQLSPELSCGSQSIHSSCTERESSSTVTATTGGRTGSGGHSDQSTILGKRSISLQV